ADVARRKLEAEQALAATRAARVRVEGDTAESRQKQLADSAQRKRLRNERYVSILTRTWQAARGPTVVVSIIAMALVIGVNAFMPESQPPKELDAPVSQPVSKPAAGIHRAAIAFFKTDKDLDAFAV